MMFFSVGMREPDEPSAPTIYIGIDVRFSVEQQNKIKNNIDRWQRALGDVVHIVPIWNQRAPGKVRDNDKPINHNFMWSVDRSREELGDAAFIKSFGNLAEVDNDHVGEGCNILMYRHIETADFSKINLHELGHVLSVQHSERYGSIMYPYVWGQTDQLDDESISQACHHYGGKVQHHICQR